MEGFSTRIMICEDDPIISVWLSDAFRQAGYDVVCVYSSEDALETALRKSVDACVVDEKAFGNGGLDLVKELRSSEYEQPVILMSDSGSTEHIVEVYKAGTTDFLVKPFSVEVILCKIYALLRLAAKKEEDTRTVFRLGSLTFDSVTQTLGNRKLTSRESALLLLLCRHENEFVSGVYILKHLWGRDDHFSTRSFYVYVCNLRKYLEPEGVAIISGRKSGYKLMTRNANASHSLMSEETA